MLTLAQVNWILNPFNTVRYNSNIKPDSRTLKTSFITKMKDTYHVFAGGTSVFGKDSNGDRCFLRFDLATLPGLLDYATLGTFRLVHKMDTWLADVVYTETDGTKGFKKAGIYAIKALAAIPFAAVRLTHIIANGIVRPAAAAALMLAFSPIVAISWGIAKLVRNAKAKKAATEIDVEIVTGLPTIDPNTHELIYPTKNAKLHDALCAFQANEFYEASPEISANEICVKKNGFQDGEVTFHRIFKQKNGSIADLIIAFGHFNSHDPTRFKQGIQLIEINKTGRSALQNRPGCDATRPRGR